MQRAVIMHLGLQQITPCCNYWWDGEEIPLVPQMNVRKRQLILVPSQMGKRATWPFHTRFCFSCAIANAPFKYLWWHLITRIQHVAASKSGVRSDITVRIRFAEVCPWGFGGGCRQRIAVTTLSSQESNYLERTTAGSYLKFIPTSQINVVAEKVWIILLLQLSLHWLQEVSKPFKGVSVPAEPVKINLEGTRWNWLAY